MVKEGSTQIENVMTPGTADVVLECTIYILSQIVKMHYSLKNLILLY